MKTSIKTYIHLDLLKWVNIDSAWIGFAWTHCTRNSCAIYSLSLSDKSKVRNNLQQYSPLDLTNLSSAMLWKLFDGKYGVSNQKIFKSLQRFLINLVKIFKYICTGIFWDSLRGEEGCILFEGNWRSLQCSMFSTLETVYIRTVRI